MANRLKTAGWMRAWPAGRYLPAVLLVSAGMFLVLAARSGLAARDALSANQQMAEGSSWPGAPARVVLAHAMALAREGRHDLAMEAYAEAEVLGSDSVRQAARVNVANLYLSRGLSAARDDGNAQRAIALLQLAKGGYRRALRERPDDWNARYNFELTLRVLPDFEARNWRVSGNQAEVEERLLKDKDAWTEMIGQPRGMH